MFTFTFIAELLHAKWYTQMCNKFVNMILKLFREAFPTSSIPSSNFEATKFLRDLGLTIYLFMLANLIGLYFGENLKIDNIVVCVAC